MAPSSLASASTAAVERTSRARCSARRRPLSFFASRSVAITRAPSATKASAMARPIPCPAAVTSATLPFSRAVMGRLPNILRFDPLHHMDGPAVCQLLDPLAHKTVPLVPGDIVRERLAGIEAHDRKAERARAFLGGRQQPPAEPAPVQMRRRRDAPDQQVVRAPL